MKGNIVKRGVFGEERDEGYTLCRIPAMLRVVKVSMPALAVGLLNRTICQGCEMRIHAVEVDGN